MTNRSGFEYFIKGFSLINTPGLRRFVLVPLAINLVLFSLFFYWLYLQLDSMMAGVQSYVPDFLSWITAAILPVLMLGIMVSFSYIFSAATNWIAAPFNGLLAERLEEHLTGEKLADQGFSGIAKDIPRTIGREFTKLGYYLPRAIGFLILALMLPLIGPVIWFLFSAWMMAIQYVDYSYDNHKLEFDEMKYDLRAQKGLSFSFGTIVMVFSMIPVINFLVMPVAICGATLMYVERFKKTV